MSRESQQRGTIMTSLATDVKRTANRRSFMKKGLAAAGAAGAAGAGLLTTAGPAFAAGPLTKGDAAILRFLAAAEIIESDLWEQYAELSTAGGTVNSVFSSPNPA